MGKSRLFMVKATESGREGCSDWQIVLLLPDSSTSCLILWKRYQWGFNPVCQAPFAILIWVFPLPEGCESQPTCPSAGASSRDKIALREYFPLDEMGRPVAQEHVPASPASEPAWGCFLPPTLYAVWALKQYLSTYRPLSCNRALMLVSFQVFWKVNFVLLLCFVKMSVHVPVLFLFIYF